MRSLLWIGVARGAGKGVFPSLAMMARPSFAVQRGNRAGASPSDDIFALRPRPLTLNRNARMPTLVWGLVHQSDTLLGPCTPQAPFWGLAPLMQRDRQTDRHTDSQACKGLMGPLQAPSTPCQPQIREQHGALSSCRAIPHPAPPHPNYKHIHKHTPNCACDQCPALDFWRPRNCCFVHCFAFAVFFWCC